MPEEAPTAINGAALPTGAWTPARDAVEEGLEEAGFFISRGLLDDARAIIEEHLRRSPNHPILLERLRELDLTEDQTSGSSGTRERPDYGDGQGAPIDEGAEIARSTLPRRSMLSTLSMGPLAKPSAPAQTTEQVDVEEVFAKFKAGVRAQVSEADSATHYDFGLAYREMDLLQDAIDEFEVAARDPKRECVCQSMIGMIYRAQGNSPLQSRRSSRGSTPSTRLPNKRSASITSWATRSNRRGTAPRRSTTSVKWPIAHPTTPIREAPWRCAFATSRRSGIARRRARGRGVRRVRRRLDAALGGGGKA